MRGARSISCPLQMSVLSVTRRFIRPVLRHASSSEDVFNNDERTIYETTHQSAAREASGQPIRPSGRMLSARPERTPTAWKSSADRPFAPTSSAKLAARLREKLLPSARLRWITHNERLERIELIVDSWREIAATIVCEDERPEHDLVRSPSK